MSNKSEKYKCVSLKGELADFGNHILMPYGITLCGLPTVDCDKDEFPALKGEVFSDMISEYDVVGEWNITCKKCLEVVEIIGRANKKLSKLN